MKLAFDNVKPEAAYMAYKSISNSEKLSLIVGSSGGQFRTGSKTISMIKFGTDSDFS